ncbi:hypothetical protein ATCC90586_005541 [Pythium insidiosum]|nr:hypothetical protein ATCC90586_005541 [Pythium insidiosum]
MVRELPFPPVLLAFVADADVVRHGKALICEARQQHIYQLGAAPGTDTNLRHAYGEWAAAIGSCTTLEASWALAHSDRKWAQLMSRPSLKHLRAPTRLSPEAFGCLVAYIVMHPGARPAGLDCHENPVDQAGAVISKAEVRLAIRACARGWSGGPDSLPNDFYRIFADPLTSLLAPMFSEWYRDARLPHSFGSATVHCVPKTSTPRSGLDFRPLSLTNSDYKCGEVPPKSRFWGQLRGDMLATKGREANRRIVCATQFGFVPRRDVHDAVDLFSAIETLVRRGSLPSSAVAVLLNFAKAYDTLSRGFLLRALQRYGFPTASIAVIRQIFTAMRFQWHGRLSQRVGYGQGFDKAARWPPYFRGLDEGVTGVGYADDTGVFLTHASEEAALLQILDGFRAASGLRVNLDKSVAVDLAADGPTAPHRDMVIPVLPRDRLTRYLGVQVGSRPDASAIWAITEQQLTARLYLAERKSTDTLQRIRICRAIITPKVSFVVRPQTTTVWSVRETAEGPRLLRDDGAGQQKMGCFESRRDLLRLLCREFPADDQRVTVGPHASFMLCPPIWDPRTVKAGTHTVPAGGSAQRARGLAEVAARAHRWRDLDPTVATALESLSWSDVFLLPAATSAQRLLYHRIRGLQVSGWTEALSRRGCPHCPDEHASGGAVVHITWYCPAARLLWGLLLRLWQALGIWRDDLTPSAAFQHAVFALRLPSNPAGVVRVMAEPALSNSEQSITAEETAIDCVLPASSKSPPKKTSAPSPTQRAALRQAPVVYIWNIASTNGYEHCRGVTQPERFHANWDTWWAYKKQYEEATYQVIRVSETLRIKTRNARAMNTKAAQSGQSVMLFPESMDPFRRVFICTHGWKAKQKQKEANTGKRPRQHIRYTGCPFRFVIQVVKTKTGWGLEVMHGTFYHNHRVSHEVFQAYPSSRGIKNPDVKLVVDTMIQCGTKRSKIYDYVLEAGENLIKSDIDNMIRAYNARVTTRSDDDETALLLAKFAAEHAGNSVSVDETSQGETGVISITSNHMRESFARFPRLLLVDCTHKTNRYNYQLCTLMIMNEYGEGLPVQQSLIETNGDWHMDKVLAHFKRVNSDAHEQVRVIVVDKDLNEIRVLQAHFPHARILICTFHVIKYLKLKTKNVEFGRISTQDQASIDNIVYDMIYAKDNEEYEANYVALEALCKRLHFEAFFEYMKANWHPCKDIYDEEMNNVLLVSTHYVAKQIEPEYAAAMEKWTKIHVDVPPVRAFQYNKFQESTTPLVPLLTRAERYRVALSATQAISSELAEIDDVTEFHKQLDFVMSQWRNSPDMQDHVRLMAGMIEGKFPYDTLPGYLEEYHYNMFYNLKPPQWINDALIVALCDRICSHFQHVRSYKATLDKMSRDIIARAALDFSVVSLNCPIQFDSFSCGLFVCFKMWRAVDPNVATDMSDFGLGARRFELLRYVFEGVGPQAKKDKNENKPTQPNVDDAEDFLS